MHPSCLGLLTRQLAPGFMHFQVIQRRPLQFCCRAQCALGIRDDRCHLDVLPDGIDQWGGGLVMPIQLPWKSVQRAAGVGFRGEIGQVCGDQFGRFLHQCGIPVTGD